MFVVPHVWSLKASCHLIPFFHSPLLFFWLVLSLLRCCHINFVLMVHSTNLFQKTETSFVESYLFCVRVIFLCESYLFFCESYLFLCESYLFVCESYLFVCESYLFLCEIYLFVCESFLFVCESYLFLCESYFLCV